MWLVAWVDAWGANGEFPESAECEWPNAVTYGTWTGDVIEADGSTHEEVKASCGAAWLGNGWILTAAHCVDVEFEFGDFGSVVRFGNHTNNDDALWEGNVLYCHSHPGGSSNEDGTLWVGPDVALCLVYETPDMPFIPLVPLLVPGTCENDYLCEVAFGEPEATTNP